MILDPGPAMTTDNAVPPAEPSVPVYVAPTDFLDTLAADVAEIEARHAAARRAVAAMTRAHERESTR